MDTLELTRVTNGLYIISNHNDERLFMIGKILLNDAMRKGVKKALTYAPDFGMGRKQEIDTNELKVTLSPKSQTTCIIKLIDTEYPKKELETQMDFQMFIDLINAYEEALFAYPEAITITRVQDTFTLRTT